MSKRDIYISLSGVVRGPENERHAFRSPTNGSGRVVPANDNHAPPLAAKTVMVEAPLTTVVQAFTHIKPVP